MSMLVKLIAVILIVFGGFVLYTGGYTYKTHEQVAQLGNVKVTQEEEKGVYFPPWLGGASIVAGIFLLVITRRK